MRSLFIGLSQVKLLMVSDALSAGVALEHVLLLELLLNIVNPSLSESSIIPSMVRFFLLDPDDVTEPEAEDALKCGG